MIVAVQSQQTGAATKDCAVLWWLHVFLYEGMYFCECITLADFFQPELLGPKSVETKTYFSKIVWRPWPPDSPVMVHVHISMRNTCVVMKILLCIGVHYCSDVTLYNRYHMCYNSSTIISGILLRHNQDNCFGKINF